MPAQSQSPENKFIFHGPCPHHRDTAPTSPLAQVAAEQPLARWPSHRRKKKKRGSGRRPLSLSLSLSIHHHPWRGKKGRTRRRRSSCSWSTTYRSSGPPSPPSTRPSPPTPPTPTSSRYASASSRLALTSSQSQIVPRGRWLLKVWLALGS